MVVLITGVYGYFGSILTRYLTSKKIRVVGIGLDSHAASLPDSEYFTYYSCSITDKDNLALVFSRVEPTHVVHFACTFNRVRNRAREYFIDVGGSTNVLEISNNTPSVKQIIYSSSTAAYGGNKDNPEWIRENQPLRPGKYRYGMNKKEIEEIFASSPLRDDLNLVILRICTVTGPFFPSARIVLRLLTEFPFMPKFCKFNKIQLLHEDDFNALLELILKDEEIAGIYNMAPDSFSLVHELGPAKSYFPFPKIMIKAVLWVLWNLKLLNLQPAGLDNSFLPIILDGSKLVNRYGYHFKYSSTEALKATQEAKKQMSLESSI